MDEQIILEKQKLRKKIRDLKGSVNSDFYAKASQNALTKLEGIPEFIKAKEILAYWALPHEVHTQIFIEKWYGKKQFYLPVINGNNLELRAYNKKAELVKNSQFKVWEPKNEEMAELSLVDFALVPGVAFDRAGKRLGRGKGYYDRLLTRLNAYKVGLCFDFQLVDDVPTSGYDIVMDKVVWN